MDEIAKSKELRAKSGEQRAKGKEIRVKLRLYALCSMFYAIFLLFSQVGFCDILRLKEIPEGKEGNEVEILDEREDSFIIKVPKEEIESIQRKRPTDIKVWREKKILWEDTGDYINLYLPKEKIVLPEDYIGDEYDSAKVLKDKLNSSAIEGRPQEATFWKGTGKIVGRVIKAGQPIKGAKVKIVGVSRQLDTLSRIFGPKDKEGRSEDLVFEAVTDEFGYYKFSNIPLGEYDIYWALSDTDSWYRRLSEKPDIAVGPGETVNYPDIEIK